MSKKLVFSIVLNVALVGLLVGQEIRKRRFLEPRPSATSAKGPCPGSGICGTNAGTLDKRVDISSDGQFLPTGFNLQVYR